MGPSIVKPKFLLDSVILIDHLRGIEPATEWLDGLEEGEAVISVVTRAEVLSGGSEEEAYSARKICDKFEVRVSLTKDDATVAAELRRENGLEAAGCLRRRPWPKDWITSSSLETPEASAIRSMHLPSAHIS